MIAKDRPSRIVIIVRHVSLQAEARGLTPSIATELTNCRTPEKSEAWCSRCHGPGRPQRIFRDVDPERWPGASLIICMTCREADLWV